MIQQGPQIDLGEESMAQRIRQSKRERGPGLWWLRGTLLVGVTLFITLFIVGMGWWRNLAPAPRKHKVANTPLVSEESAARTVTVLPESPSHAAVALLHDDGKLIWDSPTRGLELDLRYLPAGVHLLVHFRPEEIGAHPEGEKIVAVLGSWGAGLLTNFQRWYPGPWQEVPSAMLSVGSGVHGKLHYSLRIQLATVWTSHMLQEKIEQQGVGRCESREHQQHKYFVADGISYWLPVGAAGKILLVCLQEDMPSLLDNSHEPLGLPRDVQRLVASTDQQRMFTALSLVKFLQGAGKKLIAGNSVSANPLPTALAWLWGKDATAVAISMHWDQDFFMEYLTVATLDIRPHLYLRQLSQRIEELPSWCQHYLHSRVIEAYGHQVLTRLPDMLEKLLVYTRSGTEQGHVVFRSYLPIQAGHNLLLAGSLCLTSISKDDQRETDRSSASENSVVAIEEKLASITSLVLPKETLEQSLRILAEEIGVEIELLGQDLQLAGITKNQSFGINLRNRPASKILLEILSRANPVQNTTGAADRKQILVYTIKRQGEGVWRILVTTRAAATDRGDVLPDVFRLRSE